MTKYTFLHGVLVPSRHPVVVRIPTIERNGKRSMTTNGTTPVTLRDGKAWISVAGTKVGPPACVGSPINQPTDVEDFYLTDYVELVFAAASELKWVYANGRGTLEVYTEGAATLLGGSRVFDGAAAFDPAGYIDWTSADEGNSPHEPPGPTTKPMPGPAGDGGHGGGE